jgi:anaphase-promoting complex subunit 6
LNGSYETSLEHLEKAYELVGSPSIVNRVSEPIVFNLAHCYRKLGRYEDALSLYRMCLSSGPHNASIYAAIGFTHHLIGGIELAITNYHKALGLKSSLSFIAELLKEALKESSTQSFE